ncbi:MAG: hypothetical protein IPH93_08645 [Saprospiraceae bacterium]|nr:hypothetical protein [Saprospiraceae bacterium]
MNIKSFLLLLSSSLLLVWGFKPSNVNYSSSQRDLSILESQTATNFQTIDSNVARMMVASWVDSIAKLRRISTSEGKRDSIERSVFFTKSNLEEILERLNNSSNSGVRIYFGNYADTEPIIAYLTEKNKIEYLNHFSVILQMTDGQGNSSLGKALVNVGNLCPPKCPAGESKDPMYD